MLKGEVIEDAKSFKEVWKNFLHFIEMNFNGNIILVAHNGFRFDGPVLVHNVLETRNPVPDFTIADSLPAFKARYIYNSDFKRKRCYNLTHLVGIFFTIRA
jgi:hypothetical protein